MIDHPPSDDNGVQLKLISRKMVHSLNNKLFVISSYAEFLKEPQNAQEAAESIQQIQKAAEECHQIMKEWRNQADRLIPDPPGT
jgi:light-regulated signal transduction histidine kinase (bacteriophytochrome)